MVTYSHYAILGLEQGATAPDIRKAYFSLARMYHPDKSGGATTEKYLQVKEAYETLRDTERRRAYDQSLRTAPVQRGNEEQQFYQQQKAQVEAIYRTARADIEAEMIRADEQHRKEMAAIQAAGEEKRRAMGSSHEQGIADMKRSEALKQQQREKDLRDSEAKAAKLVEARRLAREEEVRVEAARAEAARVEAARVEAAKNQAQRGSYSHGGSSAYSYSSTGVGYAGGEYGYGYGYAPQYEKKDIPAPSDLSNDVYTLKATIQQLTQTLSVMQNRQAAFEIEMTRRQEQSQQDVANRLSNLEAVFRRH